MQKPDDDTTPAACLKRSSFSCSAVFADPSVQGTEQPLRVAHKNLKDTVRSLEDKREDEHAKLAILIQHDATSDKIVNEFVGRLLLLVDKDYDHPLYRRYVPKSVRDITQAEMRKEEPKMIAEIIKLLNEDLAKPGIGALATEFIPKLQAANGAVIAAEADLTTIETEVEHIDQKTIPASIVAWTTEYTKLHAALTAAWPLEPDRVERCFKPFRKAKKTKKADAPAKAPVNGSATAGAAMPDDGSG